MAAKKKTSSGGTQLPLFEPASGWRPPSMEALPAWTGARRICVDVETRDDDLKTLGIGVRRNGKMLNGVASGNYVTGYSFTIEGGPSHYLPVRHEGGDNLPESQVLAYLRNQAKHFSGDVVGANLSYDLDYLWENDIKFAPDAMYRDIQVADPLIFELHMSYSLANIASRYGLGVKEETALKEAAAAYGLDPKAGMWKLPARHVGIYAEQDTRLPLLVLREQEKLIERDDLWAIWNLESRVLPVLVKLRRRGVRVDMAKLEQIETFCNDKQLEALRFVKQETGHSIELHDVNRAEAFAPALQAIGVRIPKTETGKDSVDKMLLNSINHPVAAALGQARRFDKIVTTFAASVRRYQVNGRLHCTFNQIARENDSGDQQGARYGRLSAVDPNLQQQPARDPELGPLWRSIYIPEEGAIWACNDYSQQEPRWTTHFAAISPIVAKAQAEEAAKAYRDDPTLDNHDFMARITGLPRKAAKNIYLGLCYGEGGAKLCHDIGVPTRWALTTGTSFRDRRTTYYETRAEATAARMELNVPWRMFEAAGEEGQSILDQFDSRAPFIKQLAALASDKARTKGFIRTIGGRMLHFPETERGGFDWTHKALNRLIQGSSADQTKTAMVAIDREMPDTFLQLQVHDEMDGSVGTVAEAKTMANIMRHCIPNTLVPFRVDTEVGPSWGELKGID